MAPIRSPASAALACFALAGAPAASAQNCAPGELAAALASATPGSIVRLGRCHLQGSFKVPAGVHLQGSGTAASVIVAPERGIGVSIVASDSWAYSTLSNLRVIAGGRVGVAIRGGRNAWVRNVVVNVTRGAGIVAENVAGPVEIEEVAMIGPVTSANAHRLHNATGRSTGSHGIVMNRVGKVLIERTTASNFSQFGALFIASHVEWRGGGGSGSLAANAAFHGGAAVLEALSFTQAAPIDAGEKIGSVGLGFMAGVEARAVDLDVSENPFFGVFSDGAGSRVLHRGLRASGNGVAGVWCQNGAACDIDEATFERNRLAGIVLVDAGAVTVQQSVVSRTVGGSHPFLGTLRDGIALVRSGARLTGVRLVDNARAGVLIELAGGRHPEISFADVAVSGGGEFGVVAQQNGSALPLPDAGISRTSKLALADAAFVIKGGLLVVVTEASPAMLSAAASIARGGLAAIFGGSDPFLTE
ncbi:MAG: right-handed parallel beta-helix repeat-containing protein [Rubrivivax sp.]|nr:right-handed parallel beta-helix repeat-containing protein [Rubrivivax sp.]